MKALTQPSKKSILIGLVSFVLLFSPGHGAVKSATATLKNPWQTEATHRSGQVRAHHYFVATNYTSGFHTSYQFAALANAHSRLVTQVIKTCYHPIANDLLNAHHTYLKIAPGTDLDAFFKA